MRKSTTLGLAIGMASLLSLSPAYADDSDAPIEVVASFSILADMVGNVGGEHVRVTALVGADSDTHSFTPSPGDARRVAEADLVVFNGLQFEGWIERLIASSDYDGPLVTAVDGVAMLASEDDDHGHGHDHDHDHGELDPHAWLDVARGQQYVVNIRDGLVAADPGNAGAYRQAAERYLSELQALDEEIHALIEAIPVEHRVVITGHEAFSYFAEAYGMRFLSPVGLSTASEPSAALMGRLIDTIEANQVQALFHENITNPSMIRQLSEEAGLPIAGTLYSGALASDGEASTYAGMMRHNARLIHDALAATQAEAQAHDEHRHEQASDEHEHEH